MNAEDALDHKGGLPGGLHVGRQVLRRHGAHGNSVHDVIGPVVPKDVVNVHAHGKGTVFHRKGNLPENRRVVGERLDDAHGVGPHGENLLELRVLAHSNPVDRV